MKNKDIEDIILEYCEGFEHLEFNYSDLPEMAEKIKEALATEPECQDCNDLEDRMNAIGSELSVNIETVRLNPRNHAKNFRCGIPR